MMARDLRASGEEETAALRTWALAEDGAPRRGLPGLMLAAKVGGFLAGAAVLLAGAAGGGAAIHILGGRPPLATAPAAGAAPPFIRKVSVTCSEDWESCNATRCCATKGHLCFSKGEDDEWPHCGPKKIVLTGKKKLGVPCVWTGESCLASKCCKDPASKCFWKSKKKAVCENEMKVLERVDEAEKDDGNETKKGGNATAGEEEQDTGAGGEAEPSEAETAPAEPAAAGGPEESCHTAIVGEPCYNSVVWVKKTGITEHAKWYKGLTAATATFAEIQAFLHHNKDPKANCALPCT